MDRLQFSIKQAEEEQRSAKELFVSECNWLANRLLEAAAAAKEDQTRISPTVMRCSSVQDVEAAALHFRAASDKLTVLRQIEQERR